MSAAVRSTEALGPITAHAGGHVIEMQRRRLLLAMQEIAGESGLAEASVEAVCKRSRVSRRTFYDLFADRDACFLASFELALRRIGESILPAYEHEQRWRDRIRGGLESLLALFDEQPSLARLCVVETLKGGPAVLERRRELLDMLAGAVDRGRTEARSEGGPPPLTAEGVVGGVLAVIHARLLESAPVPLTRLAPSLVGMIVLPYLGPAASRRELARMPKPGNTGRTNTHFERRSPGANADPFRDMSIRFTYRTARVLAVIAADPGASNRHVGAGAGITDQGQASKLLTRLQRAGLIENATVGRESGEPNAWRLTPRGEAIYEALGATPAEAEMAGP